MQPDHSGATDHCSVETLKAVVLKSTDTTATIQLYSPAVKRCATCSGRGGCQSLSIYHWFFHHKPLSIPQDDSRPYSHGERLQIRFENALLSRGLLALLGAPFLGFLMGIGFSPVVGELQTFVLSIALAIVSFFTARRWVIKYITSSIVIKR